MIQAASAAMNMEGMLDAKPSEFRRLDENGKNILNKKNPVAAPHHPTYLTMIKGAVLSLNEGKGVSKSAILKYLAQHYQLGENLPKINSHLCSALRKGTEGGDIEQVKGTGASGSFKMTSITKSASGSRRPPKKHVSGKDMVKKATRATVKQKVVKKKPITPKITEKPKASKTTKKTVAAVKSPRVQKKRSVTRSKAPRAKKT